MDQQVRELEDLGLSGYEARAFLSLVSQGPMTADGVANVADIPRGRIYDVLQVLEDQSLVRADTARPKTYTGVDPTIAVQRLVERRENELNQERQRIQQTADRIESTLQGIEQTTREQRFATSAVGEGAARELLLERFEGAHASLCLAIDDIDVSPETEEAFIARFRALLDEGITLRLLTRNLGDASLEFTSLLDAGLEVRLTDHVPRQRFVVIDGTEVCLGVLHPLAEEALLAVVNLRDEPVATQLVESFDEVWKESKPFEVP